MPALDALVTLGAPADRVWVVREGDNVALSFVLKLNGTAIDLTPCSGTCRIRADYDTATDLVTAVVTFPVPTSGTVRVDLTAADTTALAAAVPVDTSPLQREVPIGVYDVELQDGTNQWTVLSGSVIVSREVTP